MAHYLVTAKPKYDRLGDFLANLRNNAYASMRPFGGTLTYSLQNLGFVEMATPYGKRKTIVHLP